MGRSIINRPANLVSPVEQKIKKKKVKGSFIGLSKRKFYWDHSLKVSELNNNNFILIFPFSLFSEVVL
jgi:hypothetical protein